MFPRFSKKIRPIDFRILKQPPYPFIVEDVLINPLQITHVVVKKTTVVVHMAGDVCYTKEEATPSLALAEFERIEREMKFSLSKVLRENEPKAKEKPVRWDMPLPDPLAIQQLA